LTVRWGRTHSAVSRTARNSRYLFSEPICPA